MSIIKRKKQDKFFIMSNHATQENLTSLNSIGLLAYIKSLPNDWVLYKTFLQKKFTRRTVDNAWCELVEKDYIAGFSCYVDRKKQYYYLANDEPLTHEDFDEFVKETLEEIAEEGYTAKNLQVIKDCKFSIAQNVQHSEKQENSSDVRSVQYKECSTPSTEHNEQIQINTDKEIEQKHKDKETIKDVNIDISNIFNHLFSKYNDGIFSINEWDHICNQLKSELLNNLSSVQDLQAYLDSSIKNICYKRKRKLGIVEPPAVPFYNWLENLNKTNLEAFLFAFRHSQEISY